MTSRRRALRVLPFQDRPSRAPSWLSRWVFLAALVGFVAALLSGCAAGEAGLDQRRTDPACQIVSGDPRASWGARQPGEPWTEGGSQYVVCAATSSGVEGSEDSAADVAASDALRQAYVFAFDVFNIPD